MFLAQLTDPEKRAFLKLARDLVALNGVVAAETEMLAAACREMGLPAEAGLELGFAEACRAFATPRARKIALMELMLLAKSDGLIQHQETDLAVQVAGAMGLGEDALAWSRRWAELVLEPYRQAVRHLDEEAGVPA